MRMLWIMGFVGFVGLVTNTAMANAQPGEPANEPPPASELPPGTTPSPAQAASSAVLPPSSIEPSNARWPALAPPGAAPIPSAPPAEQTVLESYRWQILAADTASIALALSANDATVSAAGLTYLLGAPLIHGLHGEGGRAAGSLALRLALPLVGAFVGGELVRNGRTGCNEFDPGCVDDGVDEEVVGGLLLGFGVGALTAMVLDSAVIARPIAVHRTAPTWTPQIGVTSDHVRVGVVGRF